MVVRHCSKPGCQRPAVATLTYDYADSTVVLGPLSTISEPHAYDLCSDHAMRFTVPHGWQIVRLQTHFDPAPPSSDDLLALVDAIREAAHTDPKKNEMRAKASQHQRNDASGPFSRCNTSNSESPLDPNSEYSRRRAMFSVISNNLTSGKLPPTDD